MKAIILSVLTIAVLMSSGCTNMGSFNPISMSVLEVAQNPENYYQKEITVTGTIQQVYPVFRTDAPENIKFYVSEKDKEGKPINLYLNYEKFYCSKCQIKGIINRMEICNCEQKQCNSWFGEMRCYDWSSMYTNPKSISDCENKHEIDDALKTEIYYRCQEGSKRYFYYVDVTDVTSLDKT